MRRLVPTALTLVWGVAGVTMISCAQGLTVPSHVGSVEQLVQSLRSQGLTVSLGGDISPGYFTVQARQISVEGERLNAFEYPDADTAAAEAALISSDAQPSPRKRITWAGVPRFYRQGRVIVLYVGCSTSVISALEKFLGPPVAMGQTPCP